MESIVALPIYQEIIELVQAVGKKVLAIYLQKEKVSIQQKADNTPVTQADIISHQLLTQNLKRLCPDIPILSEEESIAPFKIRQSWPIYWLIDPLDGTKEFLARSDDFSINLALMMQHQPIFGIVALPAYDLLYYTLHGYAWKKHAEQAPEALHIAKDKKIKTAVISRTHHQEEIAYLESHFELEEIIHAGSAYKFCLVAEGKADIYIRLSATYEWDTAAGHCILNYAGGCVEELDGKILTYNKNTLLLNPFFIAY